MAQTETDKTFKKYLDAFIKDKELAKILNGVTFQQLFNPDFLQAHSKFTSMDDIIWRSGFGIVNLLEVENVNQEKWDAYIAKNSPYATWHEMGKAAMIDWMEKVLEQRKKQQEEQKEQKDRE